MDGMDVIVCNAKLNGEKLTLDEDLKGLIVRGAVVQVEWYHCSQVL